jgi:hypothetical protein
MFEARTRDHLRDHGIKTNGSALSHFDRGPRDTPIRPGGHASTYGRAKLGKGGRKKGKVDVKPTDDGLETVDEESFGTLSDLVES